MPKVGGKRKKTRTHKVQNDDDEDVPQSFIFRRGKVHKPIKYLVQDMRDLMYPYASMALKESDKTRIREYVKASRMYAVSHMVIFTSTKKHNYVRYIKNPDGPTLTFKIISYSDKKNVINTVGKGKSFSRNYQAPVVILSGFHKEVVAKGIRNPPKKEQYEICASMLQAMFPPLNLGKIKVKQITRCVLFSYDEENDVIYMRHYYISLLPTSANKSMKKLLRTKKPLNLSKYNSFSEYLNSKKQIGSGNVSESEAEGLPEAKLEFEQRKMYQKDEKIKKQLSVRLTEIGPRMKLRLYKIEEGMLTGNVLYNRVVKKEEDEIEKQRIRIRDKKIQKEERKLLQQENVNAKMAAEQKEQDKKKKKQEEFEGEEKGNEEDQDEIDYFPEDKEKDPDDDGSYYSEEEQLSGDDDYKIVENDDQDVSDYDSQELIESLQKQLRKIEGSKRTNKFMEDDDEIDEEDDENQYDDNEDYEDDE